MHRQNWTLLAIYFAGGSGLSPVQLQKSLFLIGQELRETVGDSFYSFIPYNYGPFSIDVYRDANALAERDLVNIMQRTGESWNCYTISDTGREHSEQLKDSAPPNGVSYLKVVVDWAKGLTFQQLVRSIYKQYPSFRKNSVFQG